MKVICISGKAQHGKDTTARILKELLEADGCKVLIAHYGDLVKHVCRAFFDWNGEKDEKGRNLLQYVGTDVVKKERPDFWVDFICDILTFFPNEWDYALIPDCRFPEESEKLIKNGFDTTLLRVVRDGFTSPLTLEQQQHPSETAMDDYEADKYIYNNGTQGDLRTVLSDWLVEVTGSHQMSFDDYVQEVS